MKYALVFFFSVLISSDSFSQKGKNYFILDSVWYDSLPADDKAVLDSLLPLYHTAKHDSTRLSLLVALAENVNNETLWPRYNDLLFKKAESILKHSASLSPKVLRSIKKSYAMSLQNKGFFEENFNGNILAALDYYNKCRKIQEEIDDKKGLAITLNNMGIAFHSQGNVGKSLEYYMKSLKMQEAINDEVGMAYALNNIASTYIEQGDTALALEYQLKSLKLREGNGDKHGLAISTSNIAAIYNNKGQPEIALPYFYRSLKLWEELGEKQGLAYCMRYLGIIYQRKAQVLKQQNKAVPDSLLQKAEEYLLKSLSLSESIGDKRAVSLILVFLGDHYLYEKNIIKAHAYGERALSISQEIGYPLNIRTASHLMYSVFKEQGKWKEALGMLELHDQMKDSTLNEETKKTTLQKQIKYEYDKQQVLAEAEHQKQLAVYEEGKKRQQIISYAIGAGLLMVILFSIFIFNRLQVTRKQKLIIEEQKIIVDVKNKHITDSINYAKRIQDAILPSKEELSKCFSDYFILFQPKEIVSGDFYWLSAQNDKTILIIADCTGHGVPGAFMSMIGNTLLNEIVNEKKITAPAAILDHLNQGIVHALHQESRSQDDGMDISVCLFEKNKLTFAGANHSLYIITDAVLKEVKGDIYSIGSAFGPKGLSQGKKDFSFSQQEVHISKGSMVYFSTDGVSDQLGGEKGKKFLSKNLQKLLVRVASFKTTEQEEKIRTTFNEWKGDHAQLDDILLAGIRV